MSKKTTKTPAKKPAKAPVASPPVPDSGEEIAGDRHSVFDPIGRLHLADWFERWPEIFARRWPDSFEGVPFVESAFRMEQYTDDGTLVLRSELPGLDLDEDVKITVADDVLT
ncbi:MAG: hypothetical protein AAFP84_21880, partial [Actinomycetota bacterium]